VNLTPRSRYLNTETSIMIDSEQLAGQLNKTFSKLISTQNSYRLALKKNISYEDDSEGTITYEVTWRAVKSGNKHEHEPEVGPLKHLSISVLSLLPIEDLL
jgi:phosphatidylserine/phosphatidylglycerophosphate/cardiolipin synthase-like enzyme